MTSKCIVCGWEGEIDELDSEVIKKGLVKTTICPKCGAKASNDDIVREL